MKVNESNRINHFLFSIIVLTVCLMVYSIFLIGIDKNPPVQYNNLPFPVNSEQYRAGEDILINVDLCKYTKAPFTTSINFIDGLLYSIPAASMAGTPLGCRIIWTNAVTVPNNLPPGRYHLEAKNQYEVNFIATRISEWYTVEFDIVE